MSTQMNISSEKLENHPWLLNSAIVRNVSKSLTKIDQYRNIILTMDDGAAASAENKEGSQV